MYNFDPMFYADIRIEDRYSTNIVFKNNVFESIIERKDKRAFIRVFDGIMWYYASTSEISNVQTELNKLYKQAKPNKDIASNPVVAKFEVNKDRKIVFTDNNIRNVSKQDKLDLVKDCFNYLTQPYIKLSVVMYIDRSSLYEFYSSKGADIKYDHQTAGLNIMYALASQTEQFTGRFGRGETSFDKLINLGQAITKEVDRGVDFLLNAKPCKKGNFPVVLSPIVAGVFAHESFGHKSEADFMLGDETMRKEWAIGKKVASDILTIGDTGVELGSGYVPYDDEGTKATRTYLIKDGILSGRLHSSQTAVYLKEELTGNARAMNAQYEPIVRMTSTYIGSGDSTFEQLISTIKEGYFIYDLAHGSGMSQFTIAPTISYEIKDGKIANPVKISVITGSVFETLGLIDGLSDKTEMLSFVTGGCGKMEQYPLNVSFGGPYVRVSKMSVQ
ncbi:MAG: TldD/PmbA family protein [Clostridia bacterium]